MAIAAYEAFSHPDYLLVSSSVCTTIGCRYLLKDWVESFVKGKWAKWEYIDKAIELDGWKLVLIMRFSPLIPYNLLNIAMATTSMPFWQVGSMPLWNNKLGGAQQRASAMTASGRVTSSGLR